MKRFRQLPFLSGRKAFTLVELLIVIAIVAVIAALLLPVFAQARERARQAACISNERQLGSAFLLYAQDNDTRLPPQDGSGQGGVLNAVTTAWEIPLAPYLKSAGVAHCPDDTISVPFPVPNTTTVLLHSYATAWNVTGRALTQAPAPSMTVLMTESNTGGEIGEIDAVVSQLGKVSFTLDPGVVWEGPAFPHNNRGNYLFVDGHVETRLGPNPSFSGYQTSADGIALCGVLNPLPQ